ncbi:hypothetical protein [Sulfurimonas sp.]|uniref:hypothetical protein n=1 Tax=Sulfurimonas sp. TaxID=2022749 RepID=UPI0035654D85
MGISKLLKATLLAIILLSPLSAEETDKCDAAYNKCAEKCEKSENSSEKCTDKCDDKYEKCTNAAEKTTKDSN